MQYTKERLMDLPLNILRGIDVQNPEEEHMVQEVVSIKMADLPFIDTNPSASIMTDNLTPEKERELQAKLDAKRNPKAELELEEGEEVVEPDVVEPEVPVEVLPEVTPEPEIVPEPELVPEPEIIPEPEAVVKAKFCDTCDALGPIKHKKDCPKSK